MMLKEAVNSVILSVMDDLTGAIYTMAKANSHVEILGKYAGAVGNDNTHASAYTDINWPPVAKQFIVTRGLSFNSYITQMRKWVSGIEWCLTNVQAHMIMSFSIFHANKNDQDLKGVDSDRSRENVGGRITNACGRAEQNFIIARSTYRISKDKNTNGSCIAFRAEGKVCRAEGWRLADALKSQRLALQ
ncbi:hypothetical protein Tco_0169662 [Tanacetum coccineum]